MARIAHLSDFHLLEPGISARDACARFRLRYLSIRRPLDVEGRRRRALLALATACAAGFDHLVITGDLTEDGLLAQFAVAREVLEESGIAPERVTLVPGNHDAYGEGWAAALDGPLDRWAATSRPGTVTRIDGASIVAMSSAVAQSFLRSSGTIHGDALRDAASVRDDTVLLAQHHPPYPVTHQWVHGLTNHADVVTLMHERPNVSVLHGHTHRRRDRGLARAEWPRIFSPAAVAESEAPLRLYVTDAGRLAPVSAAG